MDYTYIITLKCSYGFFGFREIGGIFNGYVGSLYNLMILRK